MKKANKNNNAITINVSDDVRAEIDAIAEYYQRKPAELLRLLLVPVIVKEYADIMIKKHPENDAQASPAIFKKQHRFRSEQAKNDA